MAQNSKIREFPDISNKLTAPTKKSLFEKQKAEAEAKRQREQQETAAVYEDFIKSFDDTDDNPPSTNFNARGGGVGGGGFGSSGSGGGAPFGGGPSKRHFSGPPTGPSSRTGGGFSGGRGPTGPGSLGPPPPSLSRKRAHDGSHPLHRDYKEPSTGIFAFEDSVPGPLDAKAAFQADEEDEDHAATLHAHERTAPKPTLRLSYLPPGTSPAVIKALLPSTLTVDAVRILPSTNTGTASTERRSHSAVVTLAKETPAVDVDTAVNALQNRYLGRGFYLTLSRHLSSTVDLPPVGFASNSSLPFGARPIPTGPAAGFGRGRPAGSHRGGFAPPQSYAPTGLANSGRGAPATQVIVTPPSDLNQLKLIHKTLEALLTHGPEFEALLMSRKDVQNEEKWAWLWDSRSRGGVYYRWRLWNILSGGHRKNPGGRVGGGTVSQTIFEGGPVFITPERGLAFEYATRLDEIVSDSEYDSSDEDDSGDEGRRRHLHFQGAGAPLPEAINLEGDEQAYLNPLQKARLTHLLARLPTTSAKLRRGDVARVTAFAIEHADEGADEVVEMITLNVQRPFTFSKANPDYRGPTTAGNEPTFARRGAGGGVDEEGVGIPEDEKKAAIDQQEDTSSSKLIGLFIISDILSSSSTSGIRHAWRYRQLFESALRRHQIFESLGRLEKVMQWGRMRAEKWKRSILSVLTLWEGWCVFPQASQEGFLAGFVNPPLTKEEEVEEEEEEGRGEKEKEKEKGRGGEVGGVAQVVAKSRWRTVDDTADTPTDADARNEIDAAERRNSNNNDAVDEMDVDVDVDGEPMPSDADDYDDGDENLDGEPMDDDDDEEDLVGAEGEPMLTEAHAEEEEQQRRPKTDPSSTSMSMSTTVAETAPAGARRPRRRPKAEDMFADSDDDGDGDDNDGDGE